MDALLNYFLSERSYERSHGLAQEAVGRLDADRERVPTTADVTREMGLPGVRAPGYTYQPEGSAGTIDLQDWFSTPVGASQAFKTALGRGFDFNDLNKRVSGQIDEGRVDPGQLSDRIGGFYDAGMPETDAWLKEQALNTEDASKGRLSTALARGRASTLARGGTLEETADLDEAIQMSEGQARGREVAGQEAAAENMMNQARVAKAGAQSTAMTQAEGINAQLASTKASLTARLGETQANQIMTAAQSLASILLNEANIADQDKVQMWGALTDEISRQFAAKGVETQYETMDLNRMLQAAGITAGQSVPMLQMSPFSDATQNWMQYSALSQEPKTGSNFSASILGTGGGFGSSCIDGRAIVLVRNGKKLLGLVKVGDEILAADGKFRKVLAHDFGTAPGHEQTDMIELRTERSVIVGTPEHRLQGKPLSDWSPGDAIQVNGEPDRVMALHKVSYVPAGDVMLEGNVAYIANGFEVDSVIGAMGLEKWHEIEQAAETSKGVET